MTKTINSIELAKILNIKHDSLLQRIKGSGKNIGLIPVLRENNINFDNLFIKSSYKDGSNRKRPCYEITCEGIKHLMSITHNSKRIILQKIYNEMGGEFNNIVCIDRFETSFFNKLREMLEEFNIELEQQYEVLNYKLDGYLPQYNIAIEYDDSYHYTGKQREKDLKRQQEIEKELNCEFIRLNYKDTDIHNIALIMKKINKSMII